MGCRSEPIRLKPHHFIDLLAAFGAGQREFPAHPYGHALDRVAARLLAERNATLKIELGADAICEPCVHNKAGQCDDTIDTSFRPAAPASKQEYNRLIDQRWCQRLGLRAGEVVTAREFCRRLRDRASDLTDIYRETPAERTADRARRIRAGLAWFLADVEGS